LGLALYFVFYAKNRLISKQKKYRRKYAKNLQNQAENPPIPGDYGNSERDKNGKCSRNPKPIKTYYPENLTFRKPVKTCY
jgi:hypothetical protein